MGLLVKESDIATILNNSNLGDTKYEKPQEAITDAISTAQCEVLAKINTAGYDIQSIIDTEGDIPRDNDYFLLGTTKLELFVLNIIVAIALIKLNYITTDSERSSNLASYYTDNTNKLDDIVKGNIMLSLPKNIQVANINID